MSSTETTNPDRGTTDTTESRADAGTAAERLGGPSEGDESPDTARRTEENQDTARRTEENQDTARRAEESSDTARTAAESPDTARRAEESQDSAYRAADAGAADQGDADGQRATLIAPERADGYNSRWNQLKSDFVDEPRRAVRGANELVGEVLDELEELFRRQRTDLEQGLENEQTTTEDLRLALGRYRSFFDRLLSF
jgi:hypothetical protein